MKKTLLYAFSWVFVSSCIMHYYNHQLSIINLSGRKLSIDYSNEIVINKENNVAFYIAEANIIQPNSTFNIVIPGNENAWHEYIQEGSTKKLHLYVFETDTLRKYQNTSMTELARINKYYKLFTYSEKELDKLKWNIKIGKQQESRYD